MTDVKEGQRVRVVLEGDAYNVREGDFTIGVRDANWITGAAQHVKSVEVLPEPVKVGDVLNGDSPEPPVGTIVFTDHIHPSTWQRREDQEDDSRNWLPSNVAGWAPDNWAFVSTHLDGARVVYLPDADA